MHLVDTHGYVWIQNKYGVYVHVFFKSVVSPASRLAKSTKAPAIIMPS
jgi:hypothetical protein